jgi:hypothetical protein
MKCRETACARFSTFRLKPLVSRVKRRIPIRIVSHNVDWAQIQKQYAGGEVGKYSPAVCIGTKRRVVKGDPDPDRISTSYVERQNPSEPQGALPEDAGDGCRRCRPHLVRGRDRGAAGLRGRSGVPAPDRQNVGRRTATSTIQPGGSDSIRTTRHDPLIPVESPKLVPASCLIGDRRTRCTLRL